LGRPVRSSVRTMRVPPGTKISIANRLAIILAILIARRIVPHPDSRSMPPRRRRPVEGLVGPGWRPCLSSGRTRCRSQAKVSPGMNPIGGRELRRHHAFGNCSKSLAGTIRIRDTCARLQAGLGAGKAVAREGGG
jgi:hypothetical protein